MLIKTDLAHRLRQGAVDHLESDELDAVLGWITGAQRQPAVLLASVLGESGNDPALLRCVYEQVDRALFLEGNLREGVAGVSGTLAEDHRRARYRRLMAAFHPDRHPDADLAEWLTARSQAIHRAYERFRRGDVPGTKPALRPETVSAPEVRRSAKRHIPRVTFGPGLIQLLRTRVREIRNLEAKILGGLAILFFLPVLVLYLNQYSVPPVQSIPSSPSPTPALERADAGGGTRGADAPVPALSELEGRLASLEGPRDGWNEEDMYLSPESQRPVLDRLGTNGNSDRIAAREAIARLAAAREIAAIEAAAMATAARRIAEYGDEAAASMTPGRDLVEVEAQPSAIVMGSEGSGGGGRGSASGATDPDRDGTRSVPRTGKVDGWESGASDHSGGPSLSPEALSLEAVSRETAMLEAAARRAAEKEAAALEAAMRETAALEQAMRETAALKAAARQAAAREAAVREAAAMESARVPAAELHADPLVTQRPATVGGSSLSWVADREHAADGIARRPDVREVVATEAEAMEIGRRRVSALFESYQSAFKHGDIAGLMRHLGPDPRENSNRGRSWFEASFRELMERSRWRQLHLDIASIAPSNDNDWEIEGYFNLRVDYMDRPTVQASGPVQYRVSNRKDGWRIDSIDY